MLLAPVMAWSQKNHTVGPKETLFSIGRQYNVHPRELATYNNIAFESALTIGQVLKIPSKTTLAPLPHVIAEQKTVTEILPKEKPVTKKEEKLAEQPQSMGPGGDRQALLKHAPKIYTETCKINWDKPVQEVYNLIRGLSPYPGAFTQLRGKSLKVYKADRIEGLHSSITPGNFETDRSTFLRFACNNGYINILELQLEGKKKMTIVDFLRGYHFDI